MRCVRRPSFLTNLPRPVNVKATPSPGVPREITSEPSAMLTLLENPDRTTSNTLLLPVLRRIVNVQTAIQVQSATRGDSDCVGWDTAPQHRRAWQGRAGAGAGPGTVGQFRSPTAPPPSARDVSCARGPASPQGQESAQLPGKGTAETSASARLPIQTQELFALVCDEKSRHFLDRGCNLIDMFLNGQWLEAVGFLPPHERSSQTRHSSLLTACGLLND
ncbi:Protein of unknown function [Gryllus bimaculatus]|nr:Protein of unknown function [Gryllus bimaculatus]